MSSSVMIKENVSLKPYNTFGLDVVAKRFVELHDIGEFEAIVSSGELKTPFFVLGGGSNVVFCSDNDMLIVHPVNKGISLQDEDDNCVYVEAQAGEVWDGFVDHCILNGWYGLENLAGIPGTVGASPVQNVGAYGKEAKDVVERVHCFDTVTGEQMWLSNEECRFGYRDSVFKHDLSGRCLVDRVLFRLSRSFVPDIGYKALSDALSGVPLEELTATLFAATVRSVRDSKLPNPKNLGSAGSFFKNPVVSESVYQEIKTLYPELVAFNLGDGTYKLSAGWMIDSCGLKGQAFSGVGVYEKQALVLVNRGATSGEDVRRCANAVADAVYAKFHVNLTPEAIFI